MLDTTIWKPRELEILHLLAEGLTNSEIGTRLHLAHDTVRWYNKQIFEKLGVNNRTQAVTHAKEIGLLGNPPPKSVQKTTHLPIKSPVQYVANGDVHIAYQVIGNGPVDLLFIHGFLSHLELAWENPEFTHFFEQLGRFARVILFDKRGVGLSDRIQGAPTLETTIDDTRCVLDAVGANRVFVMGTSEGGAAAVLLAATYPERVPGLILYAATPKVVQTNHEPAWADPEDQFELMIERMQKTWGGAWAIEGFAPSRAYDERFRAWWAMILRAASSPSSIKAILNILRDIDIRPLLPQVHVKTLVIHKTNDHMVPLQAGRYFATHMPNASWVELPGADHIYFIDSASLIAAIEPFCLEAATDRVDTWIATLLYLIPNGNSTTSLQKNLTTHRPKRMIPTPQGMLALFDSPTRAVQCALHMRDIGPFRISLHVGECQVGDGKPVQPVLETAHLAADLASPGEIVLTRTLRDILAGSGFSFLARGDLAHPFHPLHPLPEGISLFTLI
jgi:pimeloyl-ACP methyl ester carboxylesterase/DNA-binding CsgD family transcriptional regulator